MKLRSVTPATATRLAILAAALAAGVAASPPPKSYIIATAPFAPQAGPGASGFSAAPLPNADITAPSSRQSAAASLRPSLFQPRNVYHGDGYVHGSTVQTEQEKRLRPAPGVNFSVPLQ